LKGSAGGREGGIEVELIPKNGGMVAKKAALAGACFGYRISFVDF